MNPQDRLKITYRSARVAVLCSCMLILGACGGFKPWPMSKLIPSTKLDSVEIHSTRNSNQGTVAFLDIVYSYSDDNAAFLPDKAKSWFENKSALSFSLKNTINVDNYQIPPGRIIKPVELPKGYKQARKVMLFIYYQYGESYYEMDITKLKRISIVLNEKDVDLINL